MAYDGHANFAYTTVATAPDPAASGTTLVVAAGTGTLLPPVPFNATVWPADTEATAANAEIVRVINVSTDTLTIQRAQESTTAKNIAIGWQIANTISKKVITDLEASSLPTLGNPGQVLGVGDGVAEWQGGSDKTGKVVAVCGSGPKVLYTLNILVASPVWTEVSGGLSGTRAKQIQFDPIIPGKAFVRVDTASLYRHSNIFAGGNWTAVLNKAIIDTTTGLTTDSIAIGSFGKSLVDGILYANVTTYATYQGSANFNHRFWLFHSHDDGATWTAVEYEGGLSVLTRQRYDTDENNLAIGNNIAGKVYCAITSGSFTGMVRVNKSLDGGHTISEVLYNSNTYASHSQLTLPPEGNPNDDELWVRFVGSSTSGDFPLRTTNGGTNWENWGPKGWSNLAFYDPSDSDYVYAYGWGSIGPHSYTYRSIDRGANWVTFETDPYDNDATIKWSRCWSKGDGTTRTYIVGSNYAHDDNEPRIITSEDFDTWTSRIGNLPAIGLYGVDVLDAAGDGSLLYVDNGEVNHLTPLEDGKYLTLVSGLPAWGANPVDAHVAAADPHTQYAETVELHSEDHHVRHENGGADEISVEGLSGVLATKQDADKLQGRALANTVPTDGQVIAWSEVLSRWQPSEVVGGAGGGVATHAHTNEDISSLCNGVTTRFTLSSVYVLGSTKVYVNGLIQIRDMVTGDYYEDGQDIVLLAAPETGDKLFVEYELATTGGAPTTYPYLGFGTSGDLSAEVNILAMQLVNEIKGWPTLVGNDIDLDAQAQWWDKLGTPTTAPTSVDIAGEVGITETYRDALKVVADAADEGFFQRWTYADEPRVKSGRVLSTLWAIWCVGGVGATVKLVNSDASETAAAKVTAAAWSIVEVPNHTLAGTYCDVKIILDGVGTVYAVPLGANIGARAVPLKPRGLVYRHKDNPPSTKVLTGLGDEATWTDVDITALSSPLAAIAQLRINLLHVNATGWDIGLRRNGDTTAVGQPNIVNALSNSNNTERRITENRQVLDDGQIYEYYLDRWFGTSTLAEGNIYLVGYWEWE
jgi:hypothetical protein